MAIFGGFGGSIYVLDEVEEGLLEAAKACIEVVRSL